MRFVLEKVLACTALLLAVSAVADPLRTDADWLQKMAFAAHQTNYSGVFVYQYGGRVETSRIAHAFDKDGEHERLEGLDGQRREVIRNNDKVWLYVGDKKVRVEKRRAHHAFPALLPEQLQSLKENYRVVLGEEDRVAGYHAHALIFQPTDNLRYTRKLWAHSESGLLLKAAVLDRQGIVIEQYAFSQLQIGGNADHKWLAAGDAEARQLVQQNALTPLPQPVVESAPSGWQVDGLPTGFKKIMEMRRDIAGKKFPVVHIVYSDGMAGISVFIEKVEDGADIPGLASQGAVHIYSKRVGDHLVTVVGEVPPRTVIQVADSVRYAGE